MHASVKAAFVGFTETFEGKVPYLYLDVLGYVTTGIGNLVEPMEYALSLPWHHPADGCLASQEEIAKEWLLVKNTKSLAHDGHLAAKKLTKLRLSDDEIQALVFGKLKEIDGHLEAQFPGYAEWPADAALGILSMSWAAGAHVFHGFPKFSYACKELDFGTAAIQCHLEDSHNPGLRPRNAANVKLFSNAAQVVARGMDFDTLYYPLSPGEPFPAEEVKREQFAGFIPVPFPSISEYPSLDDVPSVSDTEIAGLVVDAAPSSSDPIVSSNDDSGSDSDDV